MVPQLIGSSSSLQVVNHFEDVSLGLSVLGVCEIDLLELLNLSIQVVIDGGQAVVEDLEVIAHELVGKGQDVGKVSGLVLQKPCRVE